MWTLVAVMGGFVVAFAALLLFAATKRPVAEQRAAKKADADAELSRAGVAPVGDDPWLLNRTSSPSSSSTCGPSPALTIT